MCDEKGRHCGHEDGKEDGSFGAEDSGGPKKDTRELRCGPWTVGPPNRRDKSAFTSNVGPVYQSQSQVPLSSSLLLRRTGKDRTFVTLGNLFSEGARF